MGGMMKKTYIILSVLTIGFCAGCRVQEVRTAIPSLVNFDFLASEDVSIRVEKTYAADSELVIYGKVKRMPDNCCDRTTGTLNLMVVDPEGEVIDTITASYTPRNIPKARARTSSFTARLPYILPKDFTVRIGFQRQS